MQYVRAHATFIADLKVQTTQQHPLDTSIENVTIQLGIYYLCAVILTTYLICN